MNTKPANRLIVLGTIICQMGLGTIYTWSLFNQPLVDKFHWGLADVATTFSITSFFLAFATLFAGKLQERFGIRNLTLCSGILVGLGLIASAHVSSLDMIYLLAGVVVGFAVGIAYISTLSNLIKWFPANKGLISGISVGAFGSGSLLFKYVNAALIADVGVSGAFFYWGAIVMGLIVVGSLLLKEPVLATNAAARRQRSGQRLQRAPDAGHQRSLPAVHHLLRCLHERSVPYRHRERHGRSTGRDGFGHRRQHRVRRRHLQHRRPHHPGYAVR